jgi:thiol-disulfide isomerase/thioredoxin
LWAAGGLWAAAPPPLTWVESGLAKVALSGKEVQIKLSAERPEAFKTVPDGLTKPRYGTFTGGPSGFEQTFGFIIDEPPGQFVRLWVDATANGQFAIEPGFQRDPASGDGKGAVTLQLGTGQTVRRCQFLASFSNPADTSRAWARDVLLLKPDCGWRGTLAFGDKQFAAVIVDTSGRLAFAADRPGSLTVLVDLSGNGKFDPNSERFDGATPFQLGATLWLVRGVTPGGVALVQRGDAEYGLPFTLKLLSGQPFDFPGATHGKLLLLDFMASWSDLSRAELPTLAQAYKAWHAKGLEILTVMLDEPERAAAAQAVGAPLAWPVAWDSEGKQRRLGRLYGIEFIPTILLLDGDSGLVLAKDLRGPAIGPAVEAALAQRAGGN